MNVSSEISNEFRLLDIQKKGLKRLGLKTAQDLLYYFPSRYAESGEVKNISELVKGETASVYGQVTGLKLKKGFRSRIPMASGNIEDATGKLQVVWFHQPYIAKMLPEGVYARFTGKISQSKKGFVYLSNPEFQVTDAPPKVAGTSLFGESHEDGGLMPIYSETQGVTSKWIYHAIQKIFTSGILDTLIDPIPEDILKKYNLPGLKTALIWIHAPKRNSDADAARKRFAFEEVFFIQLQKQHNRLENEKNPAFTIEKSKEDIEKFMSRFPFTATTAQQKAIETILEDFKSGHPMSRLLEGDVGSGKTAVAATTAYAAVTTRPKDQTFGALQVAYMCPTEILAKQHFESFIEYFFHRGIQIGLITSSGCKKFPSKVNPQGWTDISRTQLLKWIANGEIPILIGTHSLIQKAVKFKHLGYVIIDEQHRFGTNQRQKLTQKDTELCPSELAASVGGCHIFFP
jgi:ATP-dependent DNA helicase RecG